MKVLVTGAGGFVGRHVLNELKAHGHEAIAGILKNESLSDVETVPLDVCDRSQVTKVITSYSYDAIIHLAAISHVGDAEKSLANLVDVNVTGTANLLSAMSLTPKKSRFLFVSSSQVFASPVAAAALNESSPTLPETPYGWSKLAAENLCQLYRSMGHDTVIVRPFNHIGPGQLPSFVVSGLASRIKATPDRGVLKVGNLETYRDFTDVRDIVRAYRMILEATAPSPVYVLGSGKCIKIKDIVESLLKISGKTLTLEVEAALLRKVDPVKFMANASLAGQELNWRPELSIDSTLNEIYKIA
jgi:GDP-4-dehydro-6-deoxy-D-mannose reductase